MLTSIGIGELASCYEIDLTLHWSHVSVHSFEGCRELYLISATPVLRCIAQSEILHTDELLRPAIAFLLTSTAGAIDITRPIYHE